MTIIRTQTHERRDTDPVDYILQFVKDTKRLKLLYPVLLLIIIGV